MKYKDTSVSKCRKITYYLGVLERTSLKIIDREANLSLIQEALDVLQDILQSQSKSMELFLDGFINENTFMMKKALPMIARELDLKKRNLKFLDIK